MISHTNNKLTPTRIYWLGVSSLFLFVIIYFIPQRPVNPFNLLKMDRQTSNNWQLTNRSSRLSATKLSVDYHHPLKLHFAIQK